MFNLVLNIMNSQKAIDEIHSVKELERRLLTGVAFSDVESIEHDGLEELYTVLYENDKSMDAFGKPKKIVKKKAVSELSKLRSEKKKLEIALDRLTNLYLFSEIAIPEKEYLIQKTKLTSSLDEINESIGIINSGEWNQSMSDTEFIRQASEFILTKKLEERNYVSYKSLAMSVDNSVLKAFVEKIVDSITVESGRVQKIVFKNGIVQKFSYK